MTNYSRRLSAYKPRPLEGHDRRRKGLLHGARVAAFIYAVSVMGCSWLLGLLFRSLFSLPPPDSGIVKWLVPTGWSFVQLLLLTSFGFVVMTIASAVGSGLMFMWAEEQSIFFQVGEQ